MVAGYAIGGGHVLHLVCDLTIAADNARFGQTGPRVGSFDGGYGAGLLARLSARSARRRSGSSAASTTRQHALEWGLVNAVVPLDRLEEETVAWCREMLALSPFALRLLEGVLQRGRRRLAGIQQLAADATLLFYMSRGGAGGPRRLQGEAPAGLLPVPQAALTSPSALLPASG